MANICNCANCEIHTMYTRCLRCSVEIEVYRECLPTTSCETFKVQCGNCNAIHIANWYPEVDLDRVIESDAGL